MVFKTAQKSPNNWATFVSKVIAKKIQKAPNLVSDQKKIAKCL